MTRNALLSIYKETPGKDFEIIVVDNNSADNSVEMIKKEFTQVILIENKDNRGFGKANNQALKIAQGDYIMFLNTDVVVLDGALNKLINYLRNSKFINKYKQYAVDPEVTGPTEALSGAATMFRRRVYDEIGGFDERFFMYGEDLDFCKMVLDKGWKTVYVSGARIIHFGGQSSGKRKVKSLLNFYDAMWLYYKKHFKYNFLIDLTVWLGIKFRMIAALIMNV